MFSKHEIVHSSKLHLAKNVQEVDGFGLRDFVGLIKLYNFTKFYKATFIIFFKSTSIGWGEMGLIILRKNFKHFWKDFGYEYIDIRLLVILNLFHCI